MSVLTEHRSEPGDDVPPSGNTRVAVVPPITASDMVAPGEGETVVLGPDVEQSVHATEGSDEPTVTHRRPDQLRADFGAHFEANYQRLVAQLYAITLNPAEAHDVVREAYSRAWRRWAEVGSSADPTGWVRRVAVRSTMRSWRRTVARLAPGRRRGALVEGGEPRTRAALDRARAAARRRAPRRRAGRHGGRARRRGRGARAGAAGYRRRAPVRGPAAWWATPWPTSRRPRRSRSAPTGTAAAGERGATRRPMPRRGTSDDVDVHWVSRELRALDDELAEAVELPPVDSVIRQAGRTARASTAAAAAVLTVGALGGVTAVTRVGEPAPVADVAPVVAPGRRAAARRARPRPRRRPRPPRPTPAPTTTAQRRARRAPAPRRPRPPRPRRRPPPAAGDQRDRHTERRRPSPDDDRRRQRLRRRRRRQPNDPPGRAVSARPSPDDD